jgi:hypothetical protein
VAGHVEAEDGVAAAVAVEAAFSGPHGANIELKNSVTLGENFFL